MPEIDVDKILEQKEAEEKKQKAIKRIKIYGAVLAAVVLAGIAGFFVFIAFLGEKSTKYFPLTGDKVMFFNTTGENPEKWEFGNDTVEIDGYECAVINKVDTAKNRTKQNYFYYDAENGIVRYAYSNNFEDRKKSSFVYLPARVRDGKEFIAASVRGVDIKGSVEGFEIMTSAAGEFETMKVEYKGEPYYDKIMWYAKGVGIVKEKDNLRKKEMDLISIVD
ncbi:MAG: hypothetical protein ACLFP1_05790 [Candidatus Goldiibacteriota bacterium]